MCIQPLSPRFLKSLDNYHGIKFQHAHYTDVHRMKASLFCTALLNSCEERQALGLEGTWNNRALSFFFFFGKVGVKETYTEMETKTEDSRLLPLSPNAHSSLG